MTLTPVMLERAGKLQSGGAETVVNCGWERPTVTFGRLAGKALLEVLVSFCVNGGWKKRNQTSARRKVIQVSDLCDLAALCRPLEGKMKRRAFRKLGNHWKTGLGLCQSNGDCLRNTPRLRYLLF